MSNKQGKSSKPPKLSKMRRADPHFEREQAKYEQPLPSREYVLQTLTRHGAPMDIRRLGEALDIHDQELEAFQRRLGAMARDAQLMQNRRGDWLIPDKADLIRGRVQGHADGFGFLVPDEGGEDLFLSAREMEKVPA